MSKSKKVIGALCLCLAVLMVVAGLYLTRKSPLEGRWHIRAVVSQDRMTDVMDHEPLYKLYGLTEIKFEGNSFLYTNLFWHSGSLEEHDSSKDLFILNQDLSYRIAPENGEVVKKDVSTEKKQYWVELKDENTMILYEFDPTVQNATKDDMLFVFERDGEESVYIQNHKFSY